MGMGLRVMMSNLGAGPDIGLDGLVNITMLGWDPTVLLSELQEYVLDVLELQRYVLDVGTSGICFGCVGSSGICFGSTLRIEQRRRL
jgi:hypothetical protein